ncbi:MAG: S-methyl-5-thioribose-1-phosphate isomerase [Ardenticatenaceae bacterium]|nr:S-methyl-5-thioribose-1-phosphate isomerase [Anaerolineales bacterium]MCB8940287.1 S-methyl-5-thioribose-1-phosphate isomerase [Ardenticatenaceae bacterium]MCB8973302.1 S-methyl-5-thioribose-1-phosphate isomerase [Ardenticatenaceae bacterium]
MRTVFWDYETHSTKMIDQRQLPWELVIAEFTDYKEVSRAIKEMYVRGAPAIGAAAAFGMALAARQSSAADRLTLLRDLETAASHLNAARPTAVNLAWGVRRMLRVAANEELASVDGVRDAILAEAQKLADEDVALNKRMAYNGAELISDGDTILHHCNTGALATVDWGTALGVVFAAHEQGKKIHVLVDETRPRLQGARLTAWELHQRGIPFDLIADNAAGHFMRTGQVNIVLVGSDRTAANGDVANKIGTYKLAVVAKENGIPFYPVVPTSTVDLELEHGDLIPIEERGDEEVLEVFGKSIAPAGITARNPAFDVTPHRYVTGIVTEAGIVYPPFVKNLRQAVESEQNKEKDGNR